MAIFGDKSPESQAPETANDGGEKPARPAQVMPAAAQSRGGVARPEVVRRATDYASGPADERSVGSYGDPPFVLQAGKPRGEVRQKQAGAVQSVALAKAEHTVADGLESQRARLHHEVLDRLVPRGAFFNSPRIDLGGAHVPGPRAVTKLEREV